MTKTKIEIPLSARSALQTFNIVLQSGTNANYFRIDVVQTLNGLFKLDTVSKAGLNLDIINNNTLVVEVLGEWTYKYSVESVS